MPTPSHVRDRAQSQPACPRCSRDGLPYFVQTTPQSRQVRIAVRCCACRHEWTLNFSVTPLPSAPEPAREA